MTDEEIEQQLRQLKSAYNVTFNMPDGQQVLMDLAKVCMVGFTLFDQNDRAEARNIGRSEIWLHIARMLNLTTEELFTLATGRMALRKPETENG